MYLELVKTLREKGVEECEIDAINDEAYACIQKLDESLFRLLKEKLEDLFYVISRAKAEKIVTDMKPYGQMWSYEQIEQLLHKKSIGSSAIDWYLVMNMCYNDYFNTAKIYGLQSDENFYFNLASNFINDQDAGPHKVAKYFCG